MTRSYVQPIVLGKLDLSTMLRSWIAENIASILIVAGYNETAPRATEEVARRFGERINVIGGTALRLNQIFGAEITSSDLRAISITERSQFDPKVADDIGGVVSGKTTEYVLCTTEIGLARTVKESKEDRIEETVLVKPKVALRSVADGLPTASKGHR